jgi:hypothetical protein
MIRGECRPPQLPGLVTYPQAPESEQFYTDGGGQSASQITDTYLPFLVPS